MSQPAEILPPSQPQIALEDEMRKSYLDYAMSVIVSRALPDARDGLKPVHRRILFAMKEGGYDSTKPFRKSARIVGDVMGKYHPHGDSAIYDAMVRMAQDFSMSMPLVDGQGNFGSMDGDAAAAMRYTEARLAKTGEALLADIDKETVAFKPNYDESILEPVVLPSRIPNLLVNGASGIAVGMATNIPPHNLGEVIDACVALVDNPDITIEELMQFVPAPDFPTGAQILGRAGARSAYTTGNGSVVMRAKTHFEELKKDKTAIIVDEVPYQVNKAKVLERIAELVREKQIDGITDLRDESDREGVRMVIELRRDAQPDVVLNQLFKFTPLETSFGCNMLALNLGRPQTFNLKQFVEAFVQFREEVIGKRTAFDLNKARDRAHVLIGLAVAVSNLDPVIALIRKAPDPQTAREQLMATPWPAKDMGQYLDLIDDPLHTMNADGTYTLSETQARAILDLRLHRLTGLERDKILDELKQLMSEITNLLDILSNRPRLLQVLKDELAEMKEKFAVPRRSEIVEGVGDMDVEDLIPREDMVVTVTNTGYVKRVPLTAYRAQKRGGKGKSGMTTKEDDFVTDMFVASTHTPILFFTTSGYAYRLKVWQLPLGNTQAKGKALVNLLPIDQGETVSVYLRMPEDPSVQEKLDLMFATSHGTVRRNKLSDFGNIRANGLIAMKLEDGEKLVSVRICKSGEDILLATRMGKAIRFEADDIRVFAGRASTGVRGIKLQDGDEVMSMAVLKEGEASQQLLLTISEKGYGKRTEAGEYRRTGRGGSGVINMDVTDKTGEVVTTLPVEDTHQIMLVSNQGQMIRTEVASIRTTGRSAQGVRVFNVTDGEKVMSAALLMVEDEAEEGESTEA